MKTQVVRMSQTGGPEVLRLEEVELPAPGPGEVRLRQTAIGVNYVDVYHRAGLYPLPLPGVPGVEGAGVVESVGPGVEHLRPGERVAYMGLPPGGYAEARILPATRLVRVPAALDDRTAAAMMARGITAHMLLRRVTPISPGKTVLVHAAAGGLGLLLTQWARRLGATVIGTAGSQEKAELAKAHGAHHVVLYREVDFVAAVRELTSGRGVDVAYDGVGGDVLRRTLDCVRPFGMVVSVGQASGALPQIGLEELGPRRSIGLFRPSVLAYAADLNAYAEAARELIPLVAEGALKIEIGQTFPLREAAAAHRALEAGRTVGSVLLVP